MLTFESVVENLTFDSVVARILMPKATHASVGCRKFDSALARIEFNSTHFSAESNRKLVG